MRKAIFVFGLLALLILSFVAGSHYPHGKAGVDSSARRILYYACPMHPDYKSVAPGVCPRCGMQLEPVHAEGGAEAGGEGANRMLPSGTVNISLEQQQLIGVRVAAVEKSGGTHKLRVLGRVIADETRMYRLNAATDGYIQQLSNNPTGAFVKKNELLATFGAVDVMSAQQSYVSTVYRAPQTRNEKTNPEWKDQNLEFYAGRLRALGMSDTQLSELANTRKATDSIKIFSPVSGFILARNVSPGQRFEKSCQFYRIADLSHVWIEADVYDSEAESFRPGTFATVLLPNQKTLRARISNVLPRYDPSAHTMKLRLEADNPGFVLRPEMLVEVELPVRLPSGLTIPVDALLDSGLKKRAYVDRGNGFFEPREVETGWYWGDRVQIVNGLGPDDRVVVSGTFLVDSESHLKAPQRTAATSSGERNTIRPTLIIRLK